MKKLFLALTILVTLTACTTDNELKIAIPADLENYKTAMTQFIQVGGSNNPLHDTEFITQTIPTTSPNILRDSAELAAKKIKPEITVDYFQVQNNTAYIMLNIDNDGYAGVSVHIAQTHPLVEKTLLLSPEIDNVIFDYAPKN